MVVVPAAGAAAEKRRRLLRRVPSLTALALAVVAAVGTTACGGSSSASRSVPVGDVALVGDRPISKQDLAGMLAFTASELKAAKRAVPRPGTAQYAALRRSLIETLVERSEVEQKGARDLGVQISDAKVAAREAEVKRKSFGGSDERYRRELAKEHVREADVRAEIRDQLFSEAIVAKVTTGVTVPDVRVRAYYDSHRRQFTTAARRDVRHILVPTKAEAEQIEQRLARGAGFAALARRYSTDPGSRSRGGRLKGGVSGGETPPSFERVAFSLRTGEISKPVHSPYGWHVIQALSPLRPARTTPYEQARTAIRRTLLQEKKNRVMTAWAAAAEKEYARSVVYAAGYGPAGTTTGP